MDPTLVRPGRGHRRQWPRQTSCPVSCVPVDLCEESAVNTLFGRAAQTYRSIDIALNNADISLTEDDLIEHRAARVATSPRCQPQIGVSVLVSAVHEHPGTSYCQELWSLLLPLDAGDPGKPTKFANAPCSLDFYSSSSGVSRSAK